MCVDAALTALRPLVALQPHCLCTCASARPVEHWWNPVLRPAHAAFQRRQVGVTNTPGPVASPQEALPPTVLVARRPRFLSLPPLRTCVCSSGRGWYRYPVIEPAFRLPPSSRVQLYGVPLSRPKWSLDGSSWCACVPMHAANLEGAYVHGNPLYHLFAVRHLTAFKVVHNLMDANDVDCVLRLHHRRSTRLFRPLQTNPCVRLHMSELSNRISYEICSRAPLH
ncbi:hypothetical protein LXA43DRAFT_705728 [Ganoderma leucocontextum]|nr:hypothetical protein LXA43DRAFT_705728 [Ganoderma leucocontextum]